MKIYISQGNVVTQLRCGGIFSNHFIPNFFIESAVWRKLCDLLFGPPCKYHIIDFQKLISLFLDKSLMHIHSRPKHCRCIE